MEGLLEYDMHGLLGSLLLFYKLVDFSHATCVIQQAKGARFSDIISSRF